MLKEIIWPEYLSYRTGSNNEPQEFYLNGFNYSTSADFLLGYFSSAAINLLSLGFAKFIYNGGVLRLVVNNVLSEQDKEAIKLGQKTKIGNGPFDLGDIKKLKDSLDDYGTHFFQCIAYLISQDRIQIKVVTPKRGKGIVHLKSGLFSDGENVVGFIGSCNFTAFGLQENIESLEIFQSWVDLRSRKMISQQNKDFEDLFSGDSNIVNYLDIEQVKVAIKSEFGNTGIDELIVQEDELIQRKAFSIDNKNLHKTIKRIHLEFEQVISEPKFPYSEGPREYQLSAYNNWMANNYKGMFAMATGTGKTITSLNCLLNEYHKTKVYRAIIAVPTTALVAQWKKECAKFNFKNIITVSSSENWGNNLSFFNTSSKLIDTSYIVIVTYASLKREKFQSYFTQLPKDTILIADETHNLGSPGLLKLLPNIHLEKRIGLSATPTRKFDERGNLAIQEFFNDKPPYIVSYTMEEAMKSTPPSLCSYRYYPHIVKLTDQEMKEYRKLSIQLLRMGLFDKVTNAFRSTPEIERLLLKRKRIIHKAGNKLSAFRAILKEEYAKRKNLKYTLVYVPEGIEAKFDETDFSVETDDETRLIEEYTKAVRNTDGSVMVKQFTANSKNREQILTDYEEGETHVLTSMKCLDEGVDVPRSELAIFCASTGNPRQFIQRRGRVLRLHKNKIHATIHDLVVVPEVSGEANTFEMEKGLVKKELERVVDFANLAMNKTDTYETLKNILDYYTLNLNDL
jgi:superfamily II DNA or RNA helicase